MDRNLRIRRRLQSFGVELSERDLTIITEETSKERKFVERRKPERASNQRMLKALYLAKLIY